MGRGTTGVWEALSPAKVNLYLAVTGRREDGFHELVSLVAPLEWGDTLRLSILDEGEDRCFVSDPHCPADESNLAMKAIQAYRRAVPELPPISLDLEKRIPMGAGLGGGSSNASTCLLGLNALMDGALTETELLKIAAELGSDCPLFLGKGPTWMRGRGELLSPVGASLKEVLSGKQIVVFRPPFSVDTPWAYNQLAQYGNYREASLAEQDVEKWEGNPEFSVKDGLFNSFESPLKEKFIAYEVLFRRLNSYGVMPLISGSGSACFFLIDSSIERKGVCDVITQAFGSEALLAETNLA